MKNQFSQYYQPTETEFEELWASCIFVFDTNILINLYRYPIDARTDLFELLTHISDRIWIPYYVALEYQQRRMAEIVSQKKRFRDVEDILTKSENQLVSQIGQLQLKKRHSLINPEPFLREVSAIFSNFRKQLASLEKEHPDVFDQDIIRDKLDEILKMNVGTPLTAEELEEIYKEGDKRYENKIPPGFNDINKDKGKEPEFYHAGNIFKRKYGDLIIWKQLISHINSNKITHVIFVTDDEKSDWWWIVESQGKRKLGPHPDLVEELKRITDIKSFYMYSTDRFLEFGRKYLNIDVSDASIEQVRDVKDTYYTAHEEFKRSNLAQWDTIIHHLFPARIPQRYTWNDKEKIVSVLNKIGGNLGHNHTLLPSGGGLDLFAAQTSLEPECIELDFGGMFAIVRPTRLIFESFGNQLDWAYFRLETDGLSPSGIYDDYQGKIREELVDLGGNVYEERYVWDEGTYGYDEEGKEKPLPDTARLVTRFFEGAFIILAKTSFYNSIPATYDGRHNNMTADQFRELLQKLINRFNEQEQQNQM